MPEMDSKRNEIASQVERGTPGREEEQGDSALIRLARSRLRLELQGLAFAISLEATPEEYARFLWKHGAQRWMGRASPGAGEYLLKEAEAMSHIFPWVKVHHKRLVPEEAEMIMAGGCLGGWGEDRFRLARDLGLDRSAVCRYCMEACKVWGEQLGLEVELKPDAACGGGCRMTAKRK
jgi:hypothetical protein